MLYTRHMCEIDINVDINVPRMDGWLNGWMVYAYRYIRPQYHQPTIANLGIHWLQYLYSLSGMLPPNCFSSYKKHNKKFAGPEAWESSRRFVVTGGIGQGKRAITKNIMADLIVGELCTEAPIESHIGSPMLDVNHHRRCQSFTRRTWKGQFQKK